MFYCIKFLDLRTHDVKIPEAHKRFRQAQITQLNLFTADVAAPEPSPDPILERPQKATKNNQHMWPKRAS